MPLSKERDVDSFVYDPSLVLYLPFHQLDGTSFMSKDAYGHICTASGAGWTLRGRNFDGVDDYATVPDHSALQVDTGNAFTLIVWADIESFAPGGGNDRFIVRKSSSWDNGFGLSYLQNSGKIQFIIYFDDTSSRSQGLGAPLGRFTQFALTYDGSVMRSCMDTVVVRENAENKQMGSTSGFDIHIGTSARFFKGLLGEVLLYNRALFPQEIRQIYLATKWRYQ